MNRWPLDYPELVPWYERVEQWLSVAGSVEDRPRLPAGKVSAHWELPSAWEALAPGVGATGRSLVVMPYAYGAQTTVTRAGTPFNAFRRLVQPAQGWHGLSVRYQARALSLVWSAEEGRVTAVRCRNPRTSAEELVPCRAVVLAAGAVNSAQILLESANADFPAGLGNAHDVLGRYLHDHPLAKIVLNLGRRVPIVPASYITRPAIEFSEPLYASAFMQWSGAAALSRTAMAGHPGSSSEVGFSIFGTMAPTHEDFVKLDRTPTGAGPSPLLVSLRHPPQAVALLERSRDELIEWMTLAGWEPRLKSFHVEPPGNSVHYGGTCRMHDSPRFGVVDRFCRVHGVPNVAVADSSVFTTGPEKNPVLTAMALAARASDRLALEMREGVL
jgi:choline dehydrogenase-like flavoprotein